MNVDNWIKNSSVALDNQSETPRLDAEVLLCHVLKKDRAWLLAHSDHVLQGASLRKLEELLNRRKKAEPIAYILGKCEFYGREFLVDRNVLVPRPESEALVALATEQVKGYRLEVRDKVTIIDIGTGSGALAITLTLELSNLKSQISYLAIDIDPKCLNVARKNARKHNVSIEFQQGDLLAPFSNLQPTTSNLVILANLPYVPKDYVINNAAKHEPELALFGGEDGLDLYRRLFEQLKKFLVGSLQLVVFTESLPFQQEVLKKIAESSGFKQTKVVDLIQVFEKS